MKTPAFPFDTGRRIGTIIETKPSIARANFPSASHPPQVRHGEEIVGSEIGDFVVLEAGHWAILGRVNHLRLPERERLELEPTMGKRAEVHPVAEIHLLVSVNLEDWEARPGIASYPRLGSFVYAASGDFVQWTTTRIGRGPEGKEIRLDLGSIDVGGRYHVSLTAEQLFGRHCAILGATGGGKSWTISRLIQAVAEQTGKLILVDSTGEFRTLQGPVRHLHIGRLPKESDKVGKEVRVPYDRFRESDLFALFSPGSQTQAPTLRQAMKSLKLVHVIGDDHDLVEAGLLKKAGRSRSTVEGAFLEHANALKPRHCEFEIDHLKDQVLEECVWPTKKYDNSKYGDYDDRAQGYCVTLVYRIEAMTESPEMEAVFGLDELPSVFDEIDGFLEDDDEVVLRLSLSDVSYEFSCRELIANAIGRHLLDMAREGGFLQRPVVVLLDEAHGFLNKKVGDEFAEFSLDAFELIAKEGRKYSLTTCLATQRPRDIPEGVMSQMGTLIVHRLINHQDRVVVERASGEIDRSAAEYLPTLGPGEAVIIGVDLPMPLPIRVDVPEHQPASLGPNYGKFWT